MMSPSRIMTKRKHSFLIPPSKKIWCGHERNSRKEKPQFEKVGWVCSNSRKSMEKQMKLLSLKKHGNIEWSTSQNQQSHVRQLFSDDIVEGSTSTHL